MRPRTTPHAGGGYTSYWNLADYPAAVFPIGRLDPQAAYPAPAAPRNAVEEFVAAQWAPETYANVFAQLTAIVHGDPPELPDHFSEESKDFVARCLRKVPEMRATYAELLVSGTGCSGIGGALRATEISAERAAAKS